VLVDSEATIAGPLLASTSLWTPASPPRASEEPRRADAGGVVWFDARPGADPVALQALLEPHCPGIEAAMLEDLLQPDDEPYGASYADGSIRLASAFAATARRSEPEGRRGAAQRAGVLLLEPVELLAGSDWIVSCWHPVRAFHGANELEAQPPRGAGGELLARVAHRWAAGCGRNAGDLGVLVLNELALTYAPAARTLYRWLEDWELGLYVADASDRDTLAQLWGEMAVLRDWINPLNRVGIRQDIDLAWLPATEHEQVIAVDDRIDRALMELRQLGDTLRASFSVLHVQQAEEDRDRSERIQRRVEVIAAAFLVPTLIVGFYGANTWVPGQGEHWGFWAMVVVLLLLSALSIALVVYWQRQQRREAELMREAATD
jgi:hypothetical protein